MKIENGKGYMTVGKLKELLGNYPDDMPVVTPGFDECGYDFVEIETTANIYLSNPPWTWGHGGRFHEQDEGSKPTKKVEALVLNQSSYDK